MLRGLIVGLVMAALLGGYQAAAVAAATDANMPKAAAKPTPSDANAAAKAAAPAASAVKDANEMLVNGDFSGGTEHWTLEETGATGSMDAVKEGPNGKNALRMKALTIGENTWGLQIYQTGMKIKEGKPYVMTFWAKSEPAGSVTVNCMQNHDPWDHQTMEKMEVTPEWKKYEFKFIGAWDDENVRVSFTDLATAKDQIFWFADCSLKPDKN